MPEVWWPGEIVDDERDRQHDERAQHRGDHEVVARLHHLPRGQHGYDRARSCTRAAHTHTHGVSPLGHSSIAAGGTDPRAGAACR